MCMCKEGILFLVFGETFMYLAEKTIPYSRLNTDIPFCVVTNIKNSNLNKLENTEIKHIDITTNRNREIKTTMNKFSPFEKTLYIDSDAVIQHSRIKQVFELLNGYDIMLHSYGNWTTPNKVVSYYKTAMTNLNEQLPLYIYYGALIGFNKNQSVQNFFIKWNANWKKSAIGREMPSLAITAKQMSNLKIKKLGKLENIFSWTINANACVQHEYGDRDKFWKNYFNEKGTKCLA